MKAKHRIESLETLRFAAFLFIFIYHGFGTGPERFHFYAEYGAAEAVSFFFILSGFGTGFGSYGSRTEFTVKNWAADVWRRIGRFYPLYIFTILFCVINTELPAAVNAADADAVGLHGRQLLKCVLLIQSWFRDYSLYNGVGWFLSTLVSLSVLAFPFKFLLDRLPEKHGRLYSGGLAAVLIALSALYSFLIRDSADFSYLNYAFPPARLGEYLAGLCLGRLIASVRAEDRHDSGGLFTLLELLALALWIGVLFIRCSVWQARIVRWLLPNFFVIGVFAMEAGYISRIFSLKPFVLLGGLSFECYLLHQIIQLTYQRFVHLDHTVFGTVFYTVYCLGMTVFLAALLHRRRKI